MEAKELRIGNYLKTDRECQDDYVEVVEIYNENYFCTCSAGLNYQKEHVKPIPLTEEWLVRFGFEIDFYGGQGNVTYYAKKGKFKLYSIEDDKSYQYDWTKNMFVMIKNVHQLQNLYYSLTQKELIWKKYI